MYELTKEFKFEASHVLPHHEGKCKNLHGHSWRGKVGLRGMLLKRNGAEAGMLVDFGRLSLLLEPIIAQLDHHHLNDLMENPTSEVVARWIFDRLYDAMDGDPNLRDLLSTVTVDETRTSSCTYIRGPV